MRVLLVEDDLELRRAIAASLREEGYAVDTASDGEAGLWKSKQWDYDAVVLDLMLPKLDGWGVLAGLREVKQTPVLLLTARDGVGDRVRGLNGGADDYLVKPFALAELLARLRALIRRAAGSAQSVLQIGDVTIDCASRSVQVRGERVTVTPREYALVELLALHRGKVVSRTMIYEKLFDETDDTLSNLVNVHISKIRKKLGKDFVTTRRGEGYLVE